MARLRARMVATCILGGLAVASTMYWALSPLSVEVPEGAASKLLDESEMAEDPGLADALDAQAFDVMLWKPLVDSPEQAPRAVVPASASRPFRLRLVGITREDGELFAALYDPDQDRLFVVRDGDRVARYRVEGVTLAGVTLSEGNAQRELLLQRRDRR